MYDQPSDAKHPLSFVIDEVIPVSKAEQYGYSSPAAAAQDFENLAPAHYICNQMKSDKIGFRLKMKSEQKRKNIMLDGKW